MFPKKLYLLKNFITLLIFSQRPTLRVIIFKGFKLFFCLNNLLWLMCNGKSNNNQFKIRLVVSFLANKISRNSCKNRFCVTFRLRVIWVVQKQFNKQLYRLSWLACDRGDDYLTGRTMSHPPVQCAAPAGPNHPQRDFTLYIKYRHRVAPSFM